MDLFKLVARLVMDTSDFERGVSKSSGLFGKLGKTMNAGTVAMGNLISGGISRAADALVNFGQESLKTGVDFEAAMDRVAAISGTTGEKFDELVSKAMEMGAQTKFSASESAAAFEYMAMAGWDADQMMAGIAGVMDLAAASGENLAAVSDIVTDVLTAMGESAGEAGRFADVLAAASSASNTNVSMMGETFKYAAPLAGALGYSIEDLALATGLMANAGIKGSQAGTSLRSILTRLAKPVKQSQQAMDELGISMTNSDGTMKSLRDVMGDLRTSFVGLTETEQASYAAMLGGQEAMSGLLAIVNASEEDFDKLVKSIDESTGAAKTMAGIMMDNVGGSLEELGGAMETLGLTLFDKIKEPLKNGIDAVTEFVSGFTTALNEGGIEAAVQVVIDNVSALAGTFFTNVLAMLGADSAAQEEIKALLSGVFSGVVDGIGGAITSATTMFSLIRDAILGDQAAIDEINEIVSGVFGAIPDAISSAIGFLGEFFAIEIPESFSETVLTLSGWFTTIRDAIGNAVTYISSFFRTKMPDEFKKAIEKVQEIFDKIAGFINDAFTDLDKFVKTIVPEGLVSMFEKIRDIWNAIQSAISKAVDNLKSFFNLGGDSGGGAGRSFAVGLDYVPKDNYVANLHRGEAVLTRSEAEEWRAGKGGNGTTIVVNQYISSEAQTAAELMREARWEQERGVLMGYAYV